MSKEESIYIPSQDPTADEPFEEYMERMDDPNAVIRISSPSNMAILLPKQLRIQKKIKFILVVVQLIFLINLITTVMIVTMTG